MPTEKKHAAKTQPQTKQRHRRTMAELLLDPKYRASKGLDPLPGTPSSKKQPETAKEDAQGPKEPKDPSAGQEAELRPAVEAEERKFFEKTTYSMKRKAPAPCFKRMYPGSWCFEVWDTSSDECVSSYRLPPSVVDEDDAFKYVKGYCNRHMSEVANRNIVIFEVHREFRVEVTQVETVE